MFNNNDTHLDLSQLGDNGQKLVNDYIKEIRTLRNENNQKSKENELFRHNTQELEQQNQNYLQQIQLLQQKVDAKNKETELIVKSHKDKIWQLQSMNMCNSQNLIDCKQTLSMYEQENQNLKKQLDQASKIIQSQEAEHLNKKEQILNQKTEEQQILEKKFKKKIEKKNQKVKFLKAKIEEQTQEQELQILQINDYKKRVDDMSSDLKLCQEKLEEAQLQLQQKEELELKLYTQQLELQTLKKKYDDLQQSYEEAYNQNQFLLLNQQYSQEQSEQQQKQFQNDAMIKELQEQLIQLTKQTDEALNDNQQIKQNYEEATEKVGFYEEFVQKLLQLIESKGKEDFTIEEIYDAQLENLKFRINQLLSKKKKLKNKCRIFQAEIRNLREKEQDNGIYMQQLMEQNEHFKSKNDYQFNNNNSTTKATEVTTNIDIKKLSELEGIINMKDSHFTQKMQLKDKIIETQNNQLKQKAADIEQMKKQGVNQICLIYLLVKISIFFQDKFEAQIQIKKFLTQFLNYYLDANQGIKEIKLIQQQGEGQDKKRRDYKRILRIAGYVLFLIYHLRHILKKQQKGNHINSGSKGQPRKSMQKKIFELTAHNQNLMTNVWQQLYKYEQLESDRNLYSQVKRIFIQNNQGEEQSYQHKNSNEEREEEEEESPLLKNQAYFSFDQISFTKLLTIIFQAKKKQIFFSKDSQNLIQQGGFVQAQLKTILVPSDHLNNSNPQMQKNEGRKIQELLKQKQVVENENSSLKENLIQKQDMIDQLQEEVKKLEQKLNFEKQNFEKLEELIEELSKENQELKDQIQKMKKQIKEFSLSEDYEIRYDQGKKNEKQQLTSFLEQSINEENGQLQNQQQQILKKQQDEDQQQLIEMQNDHSFSQELEAVHRNNSNKQLAEMLQEKKKKIVNISNDNGSLGSEKEEEKKTNENQIDFDPPPNNQINDQSYEDENQILNNNIELDSPNIYQEQNFIFNSGRINQNILNDDLNQDDK